MNTKLNNHIDTKLIAIMSVVKEQEIEFINKVNHDLRTLEWHLQTNFYGGNYSTLDINIIKLAFINYWLYNISLEQLQDRIYAIAQDDVDRIIDPCYLTDADIENFYM